MSNIEFDYLLKYIIIGNPGVGKSNILLKYAYGQFNEEYQSTIGVEFGAINTEIKKKIFRIQIWDTAGQENFRSITRAYYKNSVCACVVYDITNTQSFNEVSSWVEDCKKYSPKTVIFVLIGNKSDLEEKRKITYEQGEKLAQKYGMLFMETSAKSGQNICKIFDESALKICENIEKGVYDFSDDKCGIKVGLDRDKFVLGDVENDELSGNRRKRCCL